MLVFIFTLSLENCKGIRRVPGVGQGFTEYFRLSASGSNPFWLVYINSSDHNNAIYMQSNL